MTTVTLSLTAGLIAAGLAIALLILGNQLRGHRLRRLDHWTREFYKALGEALARKDAWQAIDILEVMNDSVATTHSAIAWIAVLSKSKKRVQENKQPHPEFLHSSVELQQAVGHCVVAGIMASSYRTPVMGFILRTLLAEIFAEPPRAIELAGKPDLRSRSSIPFTRRRNPAAISR